MTTKTETKWTPGPWRVDATKGLPVMIRGNVPAGRPSAVAQIMRDHAWESDARLIAAAPDLYAALLAIVAEHDRAAAEIEPGFTCGCDRVCKVAHAALAKAEGR